MPQVGHGIGIAAPLQALLRPKVNLKASDPRALGLRVQNGKIEGHVFSLRDRGCYVVGRKEGADIVVPDSSISRRHCQLLWKGEAIWLEDLASANGTLLNGESVKSKALKAAGPPPGSAVRRCTCGRW